MREQEDIIKRISENLSFSSQVEKNVANAFRIINSPNLIVSENNIMLYNQEIEENPDILQLSHGDNVKIKINGQTAKFIDAIVSIDHNHLYFCQDECMGNAPTELFGKQYGWINDGNIIIKYKRKEYNHKRLPMYTTENIIKIHDKIYKGIKI